MTRRLPAAGLALILLVGLSACGGEDRDGQGVATLGGGEAAAGDDRGDGRDPEPADFQDAMLSYAECMRDNGIDMPDPQFSEGGEGGVIIGGPAVGTGASRDEFEAAEEECRPILDEVEQTLEPPSPEEQAAMRDHALAMAECMREHGIDMPDPEFGDDGSVRIEISDGGPGAGGAMEPPGEEFQAAAEACQDEVGEPPLGPDGPGSKDED